MIPQILEKEVHDHLTEAIEVADESMHESHFDEDVYLFEEVGADDQMIDFIQSHFDNTDDREGIMPRDGEESVESFMEKAKEFFADNSWNENKTVRENMQVFYDSINDSPERHCPEAWLIGGRWYYTDQAFDVLKELQVEKG